MSDNKETITFFEKLEEIIPLNKDGEVDVNKFKDVLLEGDRNNPTIKYIYSKIPEYFVRGGTLLEPYYRICTKQESKNNNYDEILLRKIANGDLSDIKQFELVFPYIKKLATFFQSADRKSYEIVTKLWTEEKVIPESWHDEFLKYKSIYYNILKNQGMFFYEDGENKYYVDGRSSQIESEFQELISANPNHEKLFKFGYKLMKCYDSCKASFGLSSNFDLDNQEKVDSEKKYQQQRKDELLKLKEELQYINKQLNKYNLITSLFNKPKKETLITKKSSVIKKINNIQKLYDMSELYIEGQEAVKEFISNYNKQYVKYIVEELIPAIKAKIVKECDVHEQKELMKLIDIIVNNFLVNKKNNSIIGGNDSLRLISRQLSLFQNASFDDFISRFDHALITMAGIPKIVICFEKLEKKDLYSILKIIRSDLMKIPTDSDHGELSNDFRTVDLAVKPSDIFFGFTPFGKHVSEQMEWLNKEFIELIKTDDIEEYIKKTGIIWYKFILIHPYVDGNGRTSRYLLNALLAHKNIIIPALYISMEGQKEFNYNLDKYTVYRSKGNWDYDGLGEEFLKYVREIAVDLSGQNRLQNNQKIVHDEEEMGNYSSKK